MAETSRLSAEDELFQTRLLEDEPELGAAVAWAKQFNALLRRKVDGNFDQICQSARKRGSCALLVQMALVLGLSLPDEFSPKVPVENSPL
jgi:glutathionylspermidine synthase